MSERDTDVPVLAGGRKRSSPLFSRNNPNRLKNRRCMKWRNDRTQTTRRNRFLLLLKSSSQSRSTLQSFTKTKCRAGAPGDRQFLAETPHEQRQREKRVGGESSASECNSGYLIRRLTNVSDGIGYFLIQGLFTWQIYSPLPPSLLGTYSDFLTCQP